jgi:hypothetical protein
MLPQLPILMWLFHYITVMLQHCKYPNIPFTVYILRHTAAKFLFEESLISCCKNYYNRSEYNTSAICAAIKGNLEAISLRESEIEGSTYCIAYNLLLLVEAVEGVEKNSIGSSSESGGRRRRRVGGSRSGGSSPNTSHDAVAKTPTITSTAAAEVEVLLGTCQCVIDVMMHDVLLYESSFTNSSTALSSFSSSPPPAVALSPSLQEQRPQQHKSFKEQQQFILTASDTTADWLTDSHIHTLITSADVISLQEWHLATLITLYLNTQRCV